MSLNGAYSDEDGFSMTRAFPLEDSENALLQLQLSKDNQSVEIRKPPLGIRTTDQQSVQAVKEGLGDGWLSSLDRLQEVWLKNIGWLKFTAATSACQGGYECGPRFEFAGDVLTLLGTAPALILAVLRFKTPSSYARNTVYCIATNWFCFVVWTLEDFSDWMDKFSKKQRLAVCGHLNPWWLVATIAVGALVTQLARYVHIYFDSGDGWIRVSGVSAAVMLPIWLYFAYLHGRAFEANRKMLLEDGELPSAVRVQVQWALQVLRSELLAGLILAIITGAHWTLTGIVGLCGVAKYSKVYFILLHSMKRMTGVADAWGLLMLSGLMQTNGGRAAKPPAPTRQVANDSHEAAWSAKVAELAGRGVRLGDLLDFYQQLLEGAMPSFDPRYSTTNDVAREAVIPMSRDGFALASIWNQQQPRLAERMVTHNWGNRFSHLVAAIISDATGCDAELQAVKEAVGAWDAKRRNSVSGDIFPLCPCGRKKYFNNEAALTELNKFDDLMRFLAREVPNFVHVTVGDENFEVFKRAWCVAEIVEGSFYTAADTADDALDFRILDAKSYRSNVDVSVEYVMGDRPPMKVGFSLVLLPKKMMMPRASDDRLLFFASEFQDLGYREAVAQEAPSHAVDRQSAMIWRYNLEVLPGREIRVHVDPSVPHRWREWFRKGIEAWNDAFSFHAHQVVKGIVPGDKDWPED
eukprot:g26891.t1